VRHVNRRKNHATTTPGSERKSRRQRTGRSRGERLKSLGTSLNWPPSSRKSVTRGGPGDGKNNSEPWNETKKNDTKGAARRLQKKHKGEVKKRKKDEQGTPTQKGRGKRMKEKTGDKRGWAKRRRGIER